MVSYVPKRYQSKYEPKEYVTPLTSATTQDQIIAAIDVRYRILSIVAFLASFLFTQSHKHPLLGQKTSGLMHKDPITYNERYDCMIVCKSAFFLTVFVQPSCCLLL